MTTRLPVTVLTGYLGAGKTTLLNRILSEDHGRRYAVIVNEFGEIGIDNDLIVDTDEELFEMNNGCVCCTVRGDLIRTLHTLLAAGKQFDGIIIETTGLADPGPVAQTFFVDQSLLDRTRIDSITTVVDAKHIRQRLADSREAQEQIAFADQILLNKVDLATPDELTEIERAIRKINPLAPIHRTTRSAIALDKVLARSGFDLDRIVDLQPHFLDTDQNPNPHVHDEHCARDPHTCPEHGDNHHGENHADDHHTHDPSITSHFVTADRPMDEGKVSGWLNDLLATKGQDILRAKGIIDVKDRDRRLVFQAVHMMLEGDYQRPWKADEKRTSRLVFIGRHLDTHALDAGFAACTAD